jgi:aryl-alcohol dehydrogenase-like predicted oxidoreductase
VAIAWLIARPGLVAPIASATSVEQLQDLIKAAELDLSAQDIEQLDRASA